MQAPPPVTLSLVIRCYNEENTLGHCVERVQRIAEEALRLELIIVDDCSRDKSLAVAEALVARYGNITLLRHSRNQDKGAALRTGFARATRDFVGVQDADLEYDPMDLRRQVVPLAEGQADVVFGSRYLSSGGAGCCTSGYSQMNRAERLRFYCPLNRAATGTRFTLPSVA